MRAFNAYSLMFIMSFGPQAALNTSITYTRQINLFLLSLFFLLSPNAEKLCVD